MEHQVLIPMRIAVLWIGMVLLTACEKVVTDVDVPKVERQLVINAFLTPDNNYNVVEVSLSKGIFGKVSSFGDVELIKNAAVTIRKKGGAAYIPAYVDTLDGYYLPGNVFPIEAGASYEIEVSHNGKQAKGSCTIPEVPAKMVKYEIKQLASLDATGNYTGPYYAHTYEWEDAPGAGKKYYRTYVGSIYTYDKTGDGVIDSIFSEQCTNVLTNDYAKGGKLQGRCDVFGFNPGGNAECIIYTTDVHYYEYHRRRLNYFGDDPFGEPVQQYSNVEGGLGVVAAYRISRLSGVNPQ